MAHLIAQSAVQPGVGTTLGKVGGVASVYWCPQCAGCLPAGCIPAHAHTYLLALACVLQPVAASPSTYAVPHMQICQCAPGAPDFRVVDLEAWKVLDAGSQGGRAAQQITYQVMGRAAWSGSGAGHGVAWEAEWTTVGGGQVDGSRERCARPWQRLLEPAALPPVPPPCRMRAASCKTWWCAATCLPTSARTSTRQTARC